MSSKQQAERLNAQAMQREKERERRRLRDRLRRQNMSQEQRDKHLARRRRNYQLRRLRAQNAKLPDCHQQNDAANTTSNASAPKLIRMSSQRSSCFDELLTSSETQDGEAEKSRKTSRRLRVINIKHLARGLHCEGKQENEGILTNHCVATKRLRLIHVKRLARAVKISVN